MGGSYRADHVAGFDGTVTTVSCSITIPTASQDVTHVTWNGESSSAHKATVHGAVVDIDGTHHIHLGEDIQVTGLWGRPFGPWCVGDVVVVFGETSRRPLVLHKRGGK